MKELSPKAKRLCLFAIVCFFALCVIQLATILCSTKHEDLFSQVAPDGTVSISDFLHYYQAATAMHSDQRQLLYNPKFQMDSMNELISPRKIDRAFYFQCLPVACPLLYPMGFFSKDVAYSLWLCLSMALAGVGVVLLNRLRPVEERLEPLEMIALILANLGSVASIFTFKLGQSSWLLAGLYATFLWSLRRNNNVLAALCLSLTGLKPQYGVLMLAPVFGLKRWRLLAYLAVFGLIQLALAGALLGWQNILDYPNILARAETDANLVGLNPEQMVSIRSILCVFNNSKLELKLNVVVLLASFAGMTWTWLKSAPLLDLSKGNMLFRLCASETLVLALFASPHTHVYDLVLLTCAGILSVSSWSKPAPKLTVSAKVWNWLLCGFPIIGWAIFVSPFPQKSQILAIYIMIAAICGALYTRQELKNAATPVE